MRAAAFVLAGTLFGAAHAADAPARSYDVLIAEAQSAFAEEDYAVAAARLDEAQLLRPYSLFVTRNRLLARYLAHDLVGAVEIAVSVADRGLALDLPSTEAFDLLRSDAIFGDVWARFDANRRPSGESVMRRPRETGPI